MSTKKLVFLIAVVVVGSLLGTAVLARRLLAVSAEQATDHVPPVEPVAASHTLAVAPTEREPVRMIRFTFLSDGVFPRSMRIRAGLINITLEDKTGTSSGLAVERIVGASDFQPRIVRPIANHWRGRELIRLTPGRYRVSNGSRSGHHAELVVEP